MGGVVLPFPQILRHLDQVGLIAGTIKRVAFQRKGNAVADNGLLEEQPYGRGHIQADIGKKLLRLGFERRVNPDLNVCRCQVYSPYFITFVMILH